MRARIADLKSLLTLPGQNGMEVRRLYASAYGSLAERKYDRALADFNKAATWLPNLPLPNGNWRCSMKPWETSIEARENFTRYQQLTSDQSAKDEAACTSAPWTPSAAKYDEEVDEAEDIIADLFNRAMNLTFNGSENRSALRAKRARVKKKDDKAKRKNRVGGFAIPFAYAQQQLSRASEHLQIALALVSPGRRGQRADGTGFLAGQRRPFGHPEF